MSQKLLPLNPRQMVGLADGNSFYCSCEESVQPWLYGKPIIVASNNDGCAIAMNRLAKKYVKMGDAMFQITTMPGGGSTLSTRKKSAWKR